MVFAIVAAALAMSVIVAARYLAVSGLFAWLTARLAPAHLRTAAAPGQIRREIGWSLASALVYGAPAGVVLWAWREHGASAIYTDWSQYPAWYLPASVLVYLIAHDTWFYWTHRAMHRPALFRRMHAVHHASRAPTAWTAMSFHPSEALTGALVIPVLVMLVPIHVAMLGLVLAVMTVMGVTNHMGWEIFPERLVKSWVGDWIITASHHQRHHEHYLCNYGLYFRFWDRLCRTDKGLAKWGVS
jgi:sterol desaturase/sphingolipid hydroxylase (fatty acid hydroxylase superfamily)